MKKRLMCLAGAACAAVALASCAGGNDKPATEGEIFHIYAWNTEFQGFFNKYVSDEKSNADPAAVHHLDGKEVKWTITTSDNGAYQQALDMALRENDGATESEKVDMFLAEADYILKYTNSSLTKDVKSIGVTDFSQAYAYTVSAASDKNGVVKGASFQCCPSAMIYRRSVAQDVLGVSDPAEVQKAVADWSKFDAVAKKCNDKGYYVTGSYADTYRVFSNNAATPWVDANKKVTIPASVQTWLTQAESYVAAGYTKVDGVWDGGKTATFQLNGDSDGKKSFCTFGPAWYYNFCMGTAFGDADKPDTDPINVNKSYGDWAICKGPQGHFWGGTWLMLPKSGSNDSLVAKTMNAFLNNEEVLTKLVKDDSQFSNNKKVNTAVATEYETKGTGNPKLNNQNDTKMFAEMADSIVFANATIYDQQCNEGLQTSFVKYLKNDATINTKELALADFYASLQKSFPQLTF